MTANGQESPCILAPWSLEGPDTLTRLFVIKATSICELDVELRIRFQIPSLFDLQSEASKEVVTNELTCLAQRRKISLLNL